MIRLGSNYRRFVGSRGRTRHDDGNERLCRSWITVAEFGYPRSSRSGRSLPSSPIRRCVSPTSFNPFRTKTVSNPTKSDGIRLGTFVRSMRSALPLCNAIFSSLDEYVGRGEVYDRTISLHLLLASRRSIYLLCLLSPLYPLHPHALLSRLRHPSPPTHLHTNTIFTTSLALGHR